MNIRLSVTAFANIQKKNNTLIRLLGEKEVGIMGVLLKEYNSNCHKCMMDAD